MRKGTVKERRTIKGERIETEAARGVLKQVLIGGEDGADNFIMRLFTLSPGGHTPRHQHEWEHEVFVLNGEGKCLLDNDWHELSTGNVVFVPRGVLHQFVNNSEKENFEFICVIPNVEEN